MLEGALQLGGEPALEATGQRFTLPRIGDYQLLEEIARGGMGVVFRAQQISLNRVVAVKLILVGQFGCQAGIARFRAEAAAAARLRHSGIVAIYDIGEEAGQHFFSMEYVNGPNLAEFLSQQLISICQAAQWVGKIADALQYAHEQGIVHRDLKPSNILIDPQLEPRITDFGLARDLKSESKLTVTGQVLGSPNYISPEQALGQPSGPASDVYSLGAILYHLITGRPPFAAETAAATLQQVTSTDPVSPRTLNPSVPRDLETICLKCLEKEPGRRYPTAAALRDELTRFLKDEPIHARQLSPPAKAWRWCRRKPAVAALAAAVVFSLLTGLIGISWQWRRAERNLYFSDMRGVLRAIEIGNISLARNLLANYSPKWWKKDQRGWEWYYAWNQCKNDEFFSIKAFDQLPVLSLDISGDGSLLAIGGSGPVILRDLVNNAELAQMRCSNFVRVHGVAFSPNDQQLFTGTSDGRVLVWNLEKRQADRVLTNGSSVRSLAVAPNGKSLAVYAHSGLTLYQLGDDSQVTHFPGTDEPDNLPGGVAFSRDSRLLAYSRYGGEIVIWNTVTKEEERVFSGHEHTVTALAFSPDGQTLVSGSRDRWVRIWEAHSGRQLKELGRFPAFVAGLCFDPDGKNLAISGASQEIRLFETGTWSEIVALKGHEGVVYAVNFLPDGNKLLSGSQDGTVKFWDVSKVTASSQRFPARVQSAELLPGGKHIFVWYTNGTQALWKTEPLEEVSTPVPDVRHLRASASTSDGEVWAAANPDGVKLMHRHTQEVLADIPSHLPDRNQRRLAFSLDGKWIAFEGPLNSCAIWSIDRTKAPGKMVTPFRSINLRTNELKKLKFSTNGRHLAALYEDGIKAEVWDLTSSKVAALTTNAVQADIAINRDGSIAVTACASGKLRVWDLRAGSQRATVEGQLGTLWAVELSPDETRIFGVGGDGRVRLWDARTLEEVALLEVHTERLEQLALSQTGETLFVLGPDSFRGLRLFTLRAPRFP